MVLEIGNKILQTIVFEVLDLVRNDFLPILQRVSTFFEDLFV